MRRALEIVIDLDLGIGGQLGTELETGWFIIVSSLVVDVLVILGVRIDLGILVLLLPPHTIVLSQLLASDDCEASCDRRHIDRQPFARHPVNTKTQIDSSR